MMALATAANRRKEKIVQIGCNSNAACWGSYPGSWGLFGDPRSFDDYGRLVWSVERVVMAAVGADLEERRWG
jgi:hypothetical protein